MAAARDDFDGPVEDILDGAGATRAELVDQVYVDRFVGITEIQVLLARVGDRQARCRHVRLAGQQLGHDFRDAGHGFYDELDAEVVGESPHEVVFRPGRAIGTDGVGGGAVTRDDPELARVEYLVEQRRRRGAGADEGRQCDDEQQAQASIPEPCQPQLSHRKARNAHLTFAPGLTNIADPDRAWPRPMEMRTYGEVPEWSNGLDSTNRRSRFGRAKCAPQGRGAKRRVNSSVRRPPVARTNTIRN